MGTKFGVVPLAAWLLLMPGILRLAHSNTILGYPNGLSDLLANVNHMTQNLQTGIAHMQQRIQQDVQAQLQQAHQTASEAIGAAKEGGSLVQLGPGVTVRNGNNVLFLSGGGAAVGPGNSHSLTVQSGVDPSSGKTFTLETEEFVQNGLLVHTRRLANRTSGTLEESGYTLNLSQPNAQPVYLPTNVTQLSSS